jgi:hypothetical protein
MAGQAQAAALMRSYLVCFLPWAFDVLHPGEKPLRMLWYLWAMCQAFQKAAIGRTTRLVINLPPRNLKSITSVAFTAWMLGNNPRLKIMLVTYGGKLSSEHIEKCRTLMNHPVYRRLFPATRLAPGGKGELVLRTTRGGGCRSVTVGGATTGFGADIILIDDAMKAEDIASEARREELDRFFGGTLVTRLNNKRRGLIISIQQRLGEDDLPARLIDAGAEHLSLPAYDDKEVTYDLGFGRTYRRLPGEVLRPDDEPRDVLDTLRKVMGPRDFATQYLQLPSALEGNIIRTDAFPRFDLDEFERREFHKVIQSWDTATSEQPRADFTVGLTFGRREDNWYLLDVLRAKMGYAALRDRIKAHARRWKADKVLIEDAGAGSHLWDDLRYELGTPPIMIRPDRDKVTRMEGQLGLIEDATSCCRARRHGSMCSCPSFARSRQRAMTIRSMRSRSSSSGPRATISTSTPGSTRRAGAGSGLRGRGTGALRRR